MLFIPFLELKSTQGISTTDSIGLGLACSKAIVSKLGGDIYIK
jgi:K+-sensing histidine kinase KdpD